MSVRVTNDVHARPILVMDTTVLLDLDDGCLLKACFRLPFCFVAPDVIFGEIKNKNTRQCLKNLGLEGMSLSASMVENAHNLQKSSHLSVADTFVLQLAKEYCGTILTGDSELRKIAKRLKIPCHGTLWVLDQMYDAQEISKVNSRHLCRALNRIIKSQRCRLPKQETQNRLQKYCAK